MYDALSQSLENKRRRVREKIESESDALKREMRTRKRKREEEHQAKLSAARNRRERKRYQKKHPPTKAKSALPPARALPQEQETDSICYHLDLDAAEKRYTMPSRIKVYGMWYVLERALTKVDDDVKRPVNIREEASHG